MLRRRDRRVLMLSGLVVVALAVLIWLAATGPDALAIGSALSWGDGEVTATVPTCNVSPSCTWVLKVNLVRPDQRLPPVTATFPKGLAGVLTVQFGTICGVLQADVTKNGVSAFGHQHTVQCPPGMTVPPTTQFSTPPSSTSTTSSSPSVPSTAPSTAPAATSTTKPSSSSLSGGGGGAGLTPQQQQVVVGTAPNGEIITRGNG